MSTVWARIRAVAEGGGEPDRWWIGPSPWPSMPVKFAGMEWRCCPDDGPYGELVYVEVHLPRNQGDPAFTLAVVVDAAVMRHLEQRHGFGLG